MFPCARLHRTFKVIKDALFSLFWQQYFDGELPFEYDQPLSNYLQDTINPVEQPNVLVENDNKPLELQHNHGFFQLPEQYEMGGNSEKDECFAESSGNLAESSDNLKDEDIDYLLDEPYPSVPDDLALNEELFLEANDLSSPVETDPTGVDILEEYLTFFDADDNLQLSFDPTELFGSEVPISGQTIPEEVIVIFPSTTVGHLGFNFESNLN